MRKRSPGCESEAKSKSQAKIPAKSRTSCACSPRASMLSKRLPATVPATRTTFRSTGTSRRAAVQVFPVAPGLDDVHGALPVYDPRQGARRVLVEFQPAAGLESPKVHVGTEGLHDAQGEVPLDSLSEQGIQERASLAQEAGDWRGRSGDGRGPGKPTPLLDQNEAQKNHHQSDDAHHREGAHPSRSWALVGSGVRGLLRDHPTSPAKTDQRPQPAR